MHNGDSIRSVSLFSSLLSVLIIGLTLTDAGAENQTDLLKITVGEPTLLSNLRYQNTAAVAVSRTGTLAAFYPKPRTGAKFYRISTDAGRTWGKERDFSPGYAGPMSVGLREGGVLFMWGTRPVEGGRRDQVEINRMIFTDDFTSWKTEFVKIHVPKYARSLDIKNLCAAKGKIIQLPNGNLLMPMYGSFVGDLHQIHRAFLVESSDRGRSWRYYATIDYSPNDPHTELPGYYLGACEPSVVLLPNGQMLAMLRTQYAHYPGEYKPLNVCWSKDLGRTWTKPTPTKPHLMNISPTLAVLDNGVVVCQYGRPGFHVAFSLDQGHTWQDRISFSHLPEPLITGQFEVIKIGPNELLAVGSDEQGTKVWPIAVERVNVSPARAALSGRVLDQKGKPIVGAIVERSPNRYAADDWLEDTKLDLWKAGPRLIGNPKLAFRSIQPENNYPTVRTDTQGHYRFDDLKLGEYVLTVEAPGYAPQHRHIKMDPQPKKWDFTLKPGRLLRGRVVDSDGKPIAGVCVVLDRRHCHSDRSGYFHQSGEAPLPKSVTLRIYKRYRGKYETYQGTIPLSQLEDRPITLKNR